MFKKNYIADCGSMNINGVLISNEFGDGTFSIEFVKELDENDVTFVCSTTTMGVSIYESDCNCEKVLFSSEEIKKIADELGFTGSKRLVIFRNDSGDFRIMFWR